MWVQFKIDGYLYRIKLIKEKKRFLKKERFILEIQELNLDNDTWETVSFEPFKNLSDYMELYVDKEYQGWEYIHLSEILQHVKEDNDDKYKTFMADLGVKIVCTYEHYSSLNWNYTKRIEIQ